MKNRLVIVSSRVADHLNRAQSGGVWFGLDGMPSRIELLSQ